MRAITMNVYKIHEHPNKNACFEWIRNHWHDLAEHSINEVIDSLKALQKKIGGDMDYCISAFPDRGEFITFENYDEQKLSKIKPDDCPLTGVCWDFDVIEGLKEGNPEKVLSALHDDAEYLYSDEGLTELCELNEYEFYENGKIA